jgi:hypothetical protein
MSIVTVGYPRNCEPLHTMPKKERLEAVAHYFPSLSLSETQTRTY